MSQKSDLATQLSMGQNGFTGFADTSAHAGPWCAIQFIVAGAFSAVSIAGNPSGTGVTGVTFPANTILVGQFSTFTLSSGTVMAYHGSF